MEDKNDGKMGWNLFLFVFWALSFEIIKFQPLFSGSNKRLFINYDLGGLTRDPRFCSLP